MSMSNKQRKGRVDSLMVMAIAIMVVIGIVMVYSSSYFEFAFEGDGADTLLRKNIIFSVIGLGVMYIVSRIDPLFFRRFAVPINAATLMLYFLLLTPLGWNYRGGLRWIRIGGSTLMPSEFGKYAAIIAMAYVLTARKEERGTPSYYFLLACPLLFVVATFIQPDMSTAIVVAVAVLAVLFLGGLNLIYIISASLLGVLAAVLAIVTSPFRIERVRVLFNPFLDPTGKGFQVLQSLYAIASGGFSGRGLGNGIQKMLYLPLAYNDYIFAVYAEELGFRGCLILIVVLSLLVLRGYKIAANARNKFSLLVAGGIMTQIAVQAIINMYVSVSIFPSTGIPFPIVSYGGTSLVATLGALGIVLAVSRGELKPLPRAYEQVEKKTYHSLERRDRA